MADAPDHAEGNTAPAPAPQAFTRREELEQARAALHKERQVQSYMIFSFEVYANNYF
jgi:hypothetical protein